MGVVATQSLLLSMQLVARELPILVIRIVRRIFLYGLPSPRLRLGKLARRCQLIRLDKSFFLNIEAPPKSPIKSPMTFLLSAGIRILQNVDFVLGNSFLEPLTTAMVLHQVR
ncbi:hypothetical protein F4776DRAFT_285477 [Hypoxylon sp. NC0597]|nr:hypothetical protein F4776DRAFT_285477 [Hypoxylon sp. NC0597]